MYLNVNDSDSLDSAVKSFEVAFRSYVSNTILSHLDSETKFSDEINLLHNKIEQSSIILSGKMKSILSRIQHNISSYYSNLRYSNDCYINQNESILPHDVSYVSDIIGLSYLFAGSYFSDLLIFKTKEEFLMLTVTYYNTRNALSHRGSELITNDDMLHTTYFISAISDFLDTKTPDCFWYRSHAEIDKIINKLNDKRSIPITINNINTISFSNKKFVCRENELLDLKNLVYPNVNFRKKPTSICIYGYGGVGKTALIHEFLKQIVKDVEDGLIPTDTFEYILFFTAKDENLSFNLETGDIELIPLVKQFSTYEELNQLILNNLKIDSFDNLTKNGLIIIDNIESITNQTEYNKIINLIRFESPSNIQYIISSRPPINSDTKLPLNSFDFETGKIFIEKYINENELNVTLCDEEINRLLELSRGNALVLVLSLNRLDANLVSFSEISKEFRTQAFADIESELSSVPPTAYELISDFMYRNTINEIENKYNSKKESIFIILKALAVYEDALDEYTLCLLTKIKLDQLKEIMRILSQFMILEKQNDSYTINEFANKYILERFIPNSIERNELYLDIKTKVREIKTDLDELEKKSISNNDLRNILKDWIADNYGDKIAISKAYTTYNNIKHSIKFESGFILDGSIDNYLKEFQTISEVTIHPYIDFQKASSLAYIDRHFNRKIYSKEIKNLYEKCISNIRFYYTNIKSTRSFAIVLWKYGQFILSNTNDKSTGCRYLEDSIESFRKNNITDSTYYQCLSLLGNTYMELYTDTKKISYKNSATSALSELKKNLGKIHKDYRGYVFILEKKITK